MSESETVFLGRVPLRQENVYRHGRLTAHFSLGAALSTWPGDLLAYRQQWEPFIAAHLSLWRYLNALFESVPDSQQCPPGIFTADQIAGLDGTMRAFCASLALTRRYISDTDPGGILTQWNAWKDTPSSEVVAGAATLLKWHQDVVMRVGGEYKDDLVKIAKLWNIDIKLPDLPTFSRQQAIIAQIEGAYLAAKGVLQIVGYSAGETLKLAGNSAMAIVEALTETAKKLPTVITSPWMWIGAVLAVAVVGGALIVYYVPRRSAA
jgi:hypothetical protein